MSSGVPLIAKEISWLSFNERVLQEAANPQVPIIERIHYLGIFSSNMDEFFRVRVADVRRLVAFSPTREKEKHEKLYNEIQQRVAMLQKQFDQTYLEALRDLARRNIYLINEKQLRARQAAFVEDYFQKQILPVLRPIVFADTNARMPQLSDSSIYFGVRLQLENDQVRYGVLEIPSPPLPRFVVIPPEEGSTRQKVIIVLENIIRHCLKDVFRGTLNIQKAEAWTFKLTRDAELELGEGVSQSILDKISSSLKKRKMADPVRLVYDKAMPDDLLAFLVRQLGFGKYDSVIGGARYHNSKDFMQFPNLGSPQLEHPRHTPVPLERLHNGKSIFDNIRDGDVLLFYPYHSFRYVEELLYTAALDPAVRSIKITLYRLASDSHIANALINAAHNQKEVTVIMELQARFDEQANIQWANQLTEAGVNVIFGVPGLKVHSKLVLISRMEGNALRHYVHVGTGNFNEKTARIYTDFALLTANQDIGNEVAQVFDFFRYPFRQYAFRELLVAPNTFRAGMVRLIDNEIHQAQENKPASITIKCNNLVDKAIIEKLYAASQAGVKIRLIVRGMISLVPGMPGVSDNIEAISIVDRYLEHARVYIFGNGGNPLTYIASADLMTRNLDHRVEVTCPVHDPQLQAFIHDAIELQWQDNTKARLLEGTLSNEYRSTTSARKVRSQEDMFLVVKKYSGMSGMLRT